MERIIVIRKLFERYFKSLVQLSFAVTKDREQAKDIVQAFFVDLSSSDKLLNIDDFERYAYRSVRNKSLSFLRDRKHFVDFVNHEYEPEEEEKTYPFPTFLLDNAIEALPPKCKAVIDLTKRRGFTYEEAAEALNLSVKTVERHMGDGLAKLRVALAPQRELFLNHAMIHPQPKSHE